MGAFSDTENLLTEFLRERLDRRFHWNTHNCGFFACDWIKKITGVDPAQPYRARVVDKESAARVLEETRGIEQIAAKAAVEHCWREVSIDAAKSGDVVSFVTPTGPALGVCRGIMSFFVGAQEMRAVQTIRCRRAWRIN